MLVTAGATAAATTYYWEWSRTPAEIRRACGLVNEAYSAAYKRTDAVNANLDQSRLAHPYRVSDVWSTEEQVRVERAAKLVRERLERPPCDDKWWGVAQAISTAAATMNPANQAAQAAADAAAELGDYSEPGPGIDPSSVGQGEALNNARAACVGR